MTWAAALAVSEPDRTPSEQAAASRALSRQDSAKGALVKRRIIRAKQRGKGRTVAPLNNTEANEVSEYARTVDAVDWLVRHADDRRQIAALAAGVAEQCTNLLEGLGPQHRSAELRLADHFWCDLLAAVAKVLRTAQGVESKLKGKTADAVSSLAREAWLVVLESRRTSHGFRPSDKVHDRRSTRLVSDRDAGLSDAIMEGTVKATVSMALDTLTAGPDTVVDEVLLEVRVAALLLCPDPGAHKLVWDECLVPLLQGQLSSVLQQQITQLITELREQLRWDVPDRDTEPGVGGSQG